MSDSLFTQLLSIGDQQKKARQNNHARKVTQDPAQQITHARDLSREKAREIPREDQRDPPRDHASAPALPSDPTPTLDLPSAEDIEALTFRLRKTLKAKVQTEIPPDWLDDLDRIASHLKVGKLELYRFIIGEFLSKVKRS